MIRLNLIDNRLMLKDLPDNSVDSIVTDPPYGISFMNKRWDHDVPSVELWRECLRVLKPGGHMLVACGTRTQHRMAVNIEDAGFEIRDVVSWLYGSGFPKAVDCAKQAAKEGLACDCQPQTEHQMRPLPSGDLSPSVHAADEPREVLQPSLSEQELSEPGATRPKPEPRQGKESCLEGRTVCGAGEGICDGSLPGSLACETQRVRAGAHTGGGEDAGKTSDENGGGAPHQPRQDRQSAGKLEGVSGSQRALDGSPFPRCAGCARPILPEGWKTALKPACEFWTLARKPLSESTVAKNVLKWGTGGLNIDGCRVETDEKLSFGSRQIGDGNKYNSIAPERMTPGVQNAQGRFPANLILDEEAAQALDEQSGVSKSPKSYKRSSNGNSGLYDGAFGEEAGQLSKNFGDTGGASRFFKVFHSLNLCDAKAIFEEWKTNAASIAETCSSQSKNHVDSALSHAVTSVLPEGVSLQCTTHPSTPVTENELETLCVSVITWIQNFARSALPELLLERRILNGCRVRCVEINALTDTMTITASHWRSDGSAENVTLIITQANLGRGEKGCASRFVYVAKASKSERNAGLEDLPKLKAHEITGRKEGSAGQNHPRAGIQTGERANTHPTVKPVTLMRYLCRLITPPGGVVLDPFMGSGSTGIAAVKEGLRFIGAELSEEYFHIATKRIEHAQQLELT